MSNVWAWYPTATAPNPDQITPEEKAEGDARRWIPLPRLALGPAATLADFANRAVAGGFDAVLVHNFHGVLCGVGMEFDQRAQCAQAAAAHPDPTIGAQMAAWADAETFRAAIVAAMQITRPRRMPWVFYVGNFRDWPARWAGVGPAAFAAAVDHAVGPIARARAGFAIDAAGDQGKYTLEALAAERMLTPRVYATGEQPCRPLVVGYEPVCSKNTIWQTLAPSLGFTIADTWEREYRRPLGSRRVPQPEEIRNVQVILDPSGTPPADLVRYLGQRLHVAVGGWGGRTADDVRNGR